MFKKIFFIFVTLAIFFFSGSAVFAQANQTKWWDFEKWAVDININKDSTFVVRETQTFNFHGNFHWTQRDISKNKVRAISDVKVFDESGRELASPEVEITDNASQVSVKINFDLTDVQKTWTFEYKVAGGLGYFEDHDELYWNAVSENRDVPIKETEVFVHLPEEAPVAQLKQTLYIGPAGDTTPSKTYEIVDGKTFKFWGNNIGPHENFTIVAGWPKGIVGESGILKINSDPADAEVIVDGQKIALRTPAVLEEGYEISSGEHKVSVEKLGWNIKGNKEQTVDVESGKIITLDFSLSQAPLFKLIDKLIYLIPIFLAAFFLMRWRTLPRIKKTIIAEYEPPDKLSPAEVSGLVYEKVRPKDFTATIVDLAFRGYLKIVEKEEKIFWGETKKYTLVKRKPFSEDQTLSEHEKKILQAIFSSSETVRVDSLSVNNSFRKVIAALPYEIMKKLVKADGYFRRMPFLKRTGCTLLFLISFGFWVVAPAFFVSSLLPSLGIVAALCLIISASYLIFAPPPLTEKGVDAKWHALGFKEYLQVAERFRLGACTPETFEQYLSYAMVFGVEKKWAERFSEIYKGQPEWYESSQPISGFNIVVFSSAIANMSTSITSAISYSSPSGSSGFGGGGGGAGGGGGGGGSSAG